MPQRRPPRRIGPQLHLHRPQLQPQRSHLPRLPIQRPLQPPHSPPKSLPLLSQQQPNRQIIALRHRRISNDPRQNKKIDGKILKRNSLTTLPQNKRRLIKNRKRILPTPQNHSLPSTPQNIPVHRIPQITRTLQTPHRINQQSKLIRNHQRNQSLFLTTLIQK